VTSTARPSRARKGRTHTAGALAALRRAAREARRLSIETGTPFYVWRDGKVVDLNANPKRGAPRSRGRRTSR
jgi:hypothetical protein